MADNATSDLPKASLAALPYELKEQIFTFLFQRQEGPIVIRGQELAFRHHSDPNRPLVGERPRAYLLDGRLYSKHPLGQTNRRLRKDISTFLRTAAVDVVTRVEGFDYSRVVAFLESLPAAKQKAFHVQPEMSTELTRTLRIELHHPFDERWKTNLPIWLSTLPPGEELFTAYTLAPYPRHQRQITDMLFSLYGYWKEMGPGPAREQLRKILGLFWGRFLGEWMRVCRAGGG